MDTRQQNNVSTAQIFSDRLATLRGSRSKRSFCKVIGVESPQTYQHYERGRVPDADTLSAIASRCNVSVDWLLGRTETGGPSKPSSIDMSSPNMVREVAPPYGNIPSLEVIVDLMPDEALQGTFSAAVEAGQPDAAAMLSREMAYRKAREKEANTGDKNV